MKNFVLGSTMTFTRPERIIVNHVEGASESDGDPDLAVEAFTGY